MTLSPLPSKTSLFTRLPALLLGFAAVVLLSSCGNRPAGIVNGGQITKVKITDLLPGRPTASADPSIPFEKKHILYGAVSFEERSALNGHYYAVFWAVDNPAPTTVRLEYRQQNTRDRLRRQDIAVRAPRGKNVTHFAVNGEASEIGGPVTAWRASIIQGGKVVGTYESFLWE